MSLVFLHPPPLCHLLLVVMLRRLMMFFLCDDDALRPSYYVQSTLRFIYSDSGAEGKKTVSFSGSFVWLLFPSLSSCLIFVLCVHHDHPFIPLPPPPLSFLMILRSPPPGPLTVLSLSLHPNVLFRPFFLSSYAACLSSLLSEGFFHLFNSISKMIDETMSIKFDPVSLFHHFLSKFSLTRYVE